MATKQPITVRPSGVTITRNKYAFTIKWKIADADYRDGQQLQYFNYNTKKWMNITINQYQVQATMQFNQNLYHPLKKGKYMTKYSIRVRGNRRRYSVEDTRTHVVTTYNPTVSAWATKVFDIKKPMKPTLTATLSNEKHNECTFAWTHDFSTSIHEWCYDLLWESVLMKNCTSPKGAEQNWKTTQNGYMTGTSRTSTSIAIEEQTELLTNASYTRWFRICARGPAGDSAWVYAKHVYAKPKQAIVNIDPKKTKVTKSASGGYTCKVEWKAESNLAYPIDLTTVQYAFETPVNGMNCPDNAGWNNANVSGDTSGIDAAAFSIGGVVSDDQCLFVRVNTRHDHESNTTYGRAIMMAAGVLTEPANLTVTMDSSTRRALVAADNRALSNNASCFLAVIYRTVQKLSNGKKKTTSKVIGVIAHGESSVTVQAPTLAANTTESFAVRAILGSYSYTEHPTTHVRSYSIDDLMSSAIVTDGGNIPKAPSTVTLKKTSDEGTIKVTFSWTWTSATAAEISWSDNPYAWESNTQPKTYEIDNTHKGQWYITGLATGKVWYVRVRLKSGSSDGDTYGAYSEIKSINLSSAPSIPVLTLSEGVITKKGSVTASWTFNTTDGSKQDYAVVSEVIESGGNTTYKQIQKVGKTKKFTIKASEQKPKWNNGETHLIVVKVISSSGMESDGWSTPVPVSVAEPLTAVLTRSQTSLVEQTVTEGEDTRTFNALTDLPMTVTATGAGAGGMTTITIERAEDYQIDRPDETDFYGFAGETIYNQSYLGESQQTIDLEDLVGNLDDGASYNLIATVQDGLGQSDTAVLPFEVHWADQAQMPTATVVIDEEELIAKLTPNAEDPATGDTCDIYRLSVDRPELIYPDAEFGTTYVDPYPAIGEFGGHRFVYKTKNGDYITDENQIAFYDTKAAEGDIIESDFTVIDFAGGRLMINRNLDVGNKWKKDFEETQYLGGSVQGDWNPAVSREASVNTVAVSILDQETIQMMRRLAVHAGVCHVRTSDGSSYNADVQVSDKYNHSNGRNVIEYDLSITRVDPETYEGMTLAEWESIHIEDEEEEEEES